MDDEITPVVDSANILAAACLQGIFDSGIVLDSETTYDFKFRFRRGGSGVDVSQIELIEVVPDE